MTEEMLIFFPLLCVHSADELEAPAILDGTVAVGTVRIRINAVCKDRQEGESEAILMDAIEGIHKNSCNCFNHNAVVGVNHGR